MTDKLAEEILAKFIEKLDYTYRYKTINERKNIINELRYLMQAYHDAKMKEVTDEDIEAYFKTWQNPRIKTADEQYEQWLNRYLEELIDSAIEGANAMRDGEIKHNG